MTTETRDLHGSAPDKANDALLLIDVINDLEFEGSDEMVRQVKTMAVRLARLKQRARAAKVPTIYVNDNFGRWRSDFHQQVKHCLQDHVKGKPLVEALTPEPEDYFVLKPKHSGFFASSLDILLQYLEVRRLIITGVATNICVLFTANDAYMRDFELAVPQDCVAANSAQLNRAALEQIETVLKADIRASTQVRFHGLRK